MPAERNMVMKRSYKLAANFNVVSIDDIDFNDLMDVAQPGEFELDENFMEVLSVSEELLLGRLLQREYDILAGIKVVPPTSSKPSKEEPEERPSEKQIEYARVLGMLNPERASKKEVWEYIKKHRGEK